MLNVRGSMSANTGMPPSLRITSDVATNVFGVTITSSPGLMSKSCVTTCIDVVQLVAAKAYFVPDIFANLSWNSIVFGPIVSESCAIASSAALRSASS